MFTQSTKWGKARKCEINGRRYDSLFEASYAQDLENLKKAGKILGFDTHVRIPLTANGYVICDYYVDFAVYNLDGTTEYVETKGIPSEAWKIKWKLFESMFTDDPNVTLRLVYQSKNPPKLKKIKKL